MYFKRNINHDCANCGKKEGGFMSSSMWKHDFNCCSDRCGFEFKKKYDELNKTEKGRFELLSIWNKMQSQSTSLLCGEPYIGYNAEMLLKRLGRL